MNLYQQLKATELPEHVDVEILSITVGDDGQPLTVRIRRPDPEALAIEVRGLPGDRPDEPTQQNLAEKPPEEEADDLARRLVARFAAVQLPDGQWVCPAFSFATPPDPELLNGHALRQHELELLALHVMRMGAMLRRGPGEAAAATFLGQRGGSAGSDGAAPLLQGVRSDAGAGAA